jgi:hypothetical protein
MTKRLALTAALAATLGSDGLDALLPRRREPREPKPDFTDEELAYVRSLPKKERKRAVEALKAKYRRVTP